MAMLKRNEPGAQLKCRKPETMADAAYAMLQQPTTHFTGQFMTDEQVLRKSGIEDMGIYAYDPNAKDLIDDLFIPGL
ncbi:SCP2 domain-containing protein [Aphelenchoides bicaudatus]|nr:SCP2 domain-containing protein [Aphelenchoides bicaudatus]